MCGRWQARPPAEAKTPACAISTPEPKPIPDHELRLRLVDRRRQAELLARSKRTRDAQPLGAQLPVLAEVAQVRDGQGVAVVIVFPDVEAVLLAGLERVLPATDAVRTPRVTRQQERRPQVPVIRRKKGAIATNDGHAVERLRDKCPVLVRFEPQSGDIETGVPGKDVVLDGRRIAEVVVVQRPQFQWSPLPRDASVIAGTVVDLVKHLDRGSVVVFHRTRIGESTEGRRLSIMQGEAAGRDEHTCGVVTPEQAEHQRDVAAATVRLAAPSGLAFESDRAYLFADPGGDGGTGDRVNI